MPIKVLSCAAAVVLLVIVLVLVLTPKTPKEPIRGIRQSQQVIVQSGYQFDLPDGWILISNDNDHLLSEIRPTSDEVLNRIFVEKVVLTVASKGNPQQALAEVQANLAAKGVQPTGTEGPTQFAGREVIIFPQAPTAVGAPAVNWYVLVDGVTQITIGCQYVEVHHQQVQKACIKVVESINPR